MTDCVKFAIFYGMEEDEIPLGTFPDTQEDVQESVEQTAEADRCLGVTEADRLEAAWEAVPPDPPMWVPPGGEIFRAPPDPPMWVPPAGEEIPVRRLNGYMTERYVADVPPAWCTRNLDDYRVLTVDDSVERNCTITIDGYVRQEKYDELVNDFNNLKAKVERLESFLSTVSSPDDEMMTI